MVADKRQFVLPSGIITRSDVGRLQREAESVDSLLKQAVIRQRLVGSELPKTSQLFREIIEVNGLNMLEEADRAKLHAFLELVRTKAPILHISFNTDASPLFQQRLVDWIRQHIHPQALLQMGLYPNIGAGCVVRTVNHYYDFSLRQRFRNEKQLLIAKMHGSQPANKPRSQP